MSDNCNFCDEVAGFSQKEFSPFFVKELQTGYVSIYYKQYYKGACLFISKIHVTELHLLDDETRKQFLYEMSLVAETIATLFKPVKINVELLGNSHPHLHWHIIPRYKEDILPKIPAWNNPNFLMAEKMQPGNALDALHIKLKTGIENILKQKGL